MQVFVQETNYRFTLKFLVYIADSVDWKWGLAWHFHKIAPVSIFWSMVKWTTRTTYGRFKIAPVAPKFRSNGILNLHFWFCSLSLIVGAKHKATEAAKANQFTMPDGSKITNYDCTTCNAQMNSEQQYHQVCVEDYTVNWAMSNFPVRCLPPYGMSGSLCTLALFCHACPQIGL